MSFFSWLRPKKKGANTRPAFSTAAKNRYPRGAVPPVKLIGIASANGRDLADTLAFTLHEACGWDVATITTDHFVRSGVAAMFGITPGGLDPVTGVDFDDAIALVTTMFEANYPGVWLRCLETAQSRLPNHVMIVHGITTEEQAAWVRNRGGRVAGDGTILSATADVPVGLGADGTYLEACEVILDAMTTAQEQ